MTLVQSFYFFVVDIFLFAISSTILVLSEYMYVTLERRAWLSGNMQNSLLQYLRVHPMQILSSGGYVFIYNYKINYTFTFHDYRFQGIEKTTIQGNIPSISAQDNQVSIIEHVYLISAFFQELLIWFL